MSAFVDYVYYVLGLRPDPRCAGRSGKGKASLPSGFCISATQNLRHILESGPAWKGAEPEDTVEVRVQIFCSLTMKRLLQYLTELTVHTVHIQHKVALVVIAQVRACDGLAQLNDDTLASIFSYMLDVAQRLRLAPVCKQVCARISACE